MCVWDENSGRITLSDACFLYADMPRKRLQAALEEFSGKLCYADDPQHATTLLTRAFPFMGAQAACVCSLSLGRLRTVEFHLTCGTAAEQRRLFFAFLKKQDPCPETMRSVHMRYAFGSAWIAADSRVGDAALRIAYAVKE